MSSQPFAMFIVTVYVLRNGRIMVTCIFFQCVLTWHNACTNHHEVWESPSLSTKNIARESWVRVALCYCEQILSVQTLQGYPCPGYVLLLWYSSYKHCKGHVLRHPQWTHTELHLVLYKHCKRLWSRVALSVKTLPRWMFLRVKITVLASEGELDLWTLKVNRSKSKH